MPNMMNNSGRYMHNPYNSSNQGCGCSNPPHMMPPPPPPTPCLPRHVLLDIINKTSFAMDDARLFLDTHPKSKEAMAYFEKMKMERKKAIKEFTKHYGPICAYDVEPCDKWKWNEGPWPWQASFMSERRG